MSEPRSRPGCGVRLPADAPEGPCPDCFDHGGKRDESNARAGETVLLTTRAVLAQIQSGRAMARNTAATAPVPPPSSTLPGNRSRLSGITGEPVKTAPITAGMSASGKTVPESASVSALK